MIKFIAFAAFALALATSAQAMSAPPLHRADGMTTETQDVGYRYRGVARYGGYRRYGYGTYSPYAIGATATARIVPTAIGATAMASAVESPAAISAEDFSGSETPKHWAGKVGHANVSASPTVVYRTVCNVAERVGP